jgi:hypothetical protein
LLGGKMSIFKCLQRLWCYSRSSRLFQWLFVIGIAVLIIGIALLSKKPPLKEKVLTCFKNKEVVLFFHSSNALTPRMSLPIESVQTLDNLPFADIDINRTKWKIAALKIFSVGDMMAELSLKGGEKYPFPMIVVVQDSAGAEYLIIGNEEKQISLSSIKYLIEHGMLDQKNKNLVKVIISGSEKNDQESVSLCIEMK